MSDPRAWQSAFGTYRDFQITQARDAALRVEVETKELQDLFGWLAGAGLRAEEELIKHGLMAERRIAMRTPVLTGRAKNSWHTVKPNETDFYQYNDNIGNTFDGTLADPTTGPLEVLVGTNVVYMLALEAGHSRQAPNGMVAITLAELSGALEARLEAIFREQGQAPQEEVGFDG